MLKLPDLTVLLDYCLAIEVGCVVLICPKADTNATSMNLVTINGVGG